MCGWRSGYSLGRKLSKVFRGPGIPSVKFPFTWCLKCTSLVFFICFDTFHLSGLNTKKTLPQYGHKSYKKFLGVLLLTEEFMLNFCMFIESTYKIFSFQPYVLHALPGYLCKCIALVSSDCIFCCRKHFSSLHFYCSLLVSCNKYNVPGQAWWMS